MSSSRFVACPGCGRNLFNERWLRVDWSVVCDGLLTLSLFCPFTALIKWTTFCNPLYLRLDPICRIRSLTAFKPWFSSKQEWVRIWTLQSPDANTGLPQWPQGPSTYRHLLSIIMLVFIQYHNDRPGSLSERRICTPTERAASYRWRLQGRDTNRVTPL